MRNKKWHYKVLATLLGVSACAGVFGACKEKTVALPDYADDREVQLLGYVNPTNGDYTFDNIPMNDGVDFRTVERFKEYKDAGLNVAFARYDSALPADVTKDTWKDSDTKVLCDKAYEAGLDKILITDLYINDLITGWVNTSSNTSYLIGEGPDYRFSSEAELDADLTQRLAIYKDTPGFYGIIMLDEPRYYYLENYGLVYNSLRRIAPDMYFYNNLHYCHNNMGPITGNDKLYLDPDKWKEEKGTDVTIEEAYSQYLTTFFENTGAKNLAIDIYPFEPQAEKRLDIYFCNAQILKKHCDKYGADMSFTGQSITYITNGKYSGRIMTKNDLWLQMNTMLGFGATSFQYYTYFPYPSYRANGTSIGSFIDRKGNKTSVYYDAQSVNLAVQKFDHILLNYDFQGAKFYLASMIENASSSSYLGSVESLTFDNSHEHTLLKGITHNNDAILTTELKDENNDLYMYMLMNPVDALFSKDGTMSYTESTVTAEFPGYDYVAEFDCGELTYVKLENGKYTKTLSSGYAVYLVPLKA